jgi:hypothetical protein
MPSKTQLYKVKAKTITGTKLRFSLSIITFFRRKRRIGLICRPSLLRRCCPAAAAAAAAAAAQLMKHSPDDHENEQGILKGEVSLYH